MQNSAFGELGAQFYKWIKDNRIRFKYEGQAQEMELEIERIVGLIGYIEKEKMVALKRGRKRKN